MEIMALKIDTFSNITGGHSFFKAVGHPLAAEKATGLFKELAGAGSVSIYDPQGFLEPLAELYDFSPISCNAVYAQKFEHLNKQMLGHNTQAITEMKAPGTLFIAAFDSGRYLSHITHLIPKGTKVLSLDDMRIPEELLTNHKNYLDPLNFATNCVFFRDQDGHHTKLVSANYWTAYSGKPCKLWLRLFDAQGKALCTWTQDLTIANSTVVLDSREIRKQFKLGEFCGQIYMQVIGAAGHDVIKYALDCYSDDGETLTCTHDAASWPADFYAGLPAPKEGEQVLLWVQNTHPCPIPKGAVGLNLMGDSKISWYDQVIPGFGCSAINVKDLLPSASWPQQIEVQAGKHFVRPRYEVVTSERRRIAHANVERTDLKSDPELKKLGVVFGKGFILPAPILPLKDWDTLALPTPMATTQQNLPITFIVYDSSGDEMGRHPFGNLARRDSKVFDVSKWLAENKVTLANGYGHVEVIYDFNAGDEADGWLHGLFRYQQKATGHEAETSFGAHIFNTAVTYKSQPFSYRGTPPGLSTRLFLRLANDGLDTVCHLIYPASTPWHTNSTTELQLHSKDGDLKSKKNVSIPCSGSLFWKASELFGSDELKAVGEDAYILITDKTCRLFGYHGLIDDKGHFSFDHMFGF